MQMGEEHWSLGHASSFHSTTYIGSGGGDGCQGGRGSNLSLWSPSEEAGKPVSAEDSGEDEDCSLTVRNNPGKEQLAPMCNPLMPLLLLEDRDSPGSVANQHDKIRILC